MNGRTLALLTRPVLHFDLPAVAVTLAEPGPKLLRRDAHAEHPGTVRGPREGAVAAPEGGEAVQDEPAVRVRDLQLHCRELRDFEADRRGLVLGGHVGALEGEPRRIDLIAAIAASVLAVDRAQAPRAHALEELPQQLVVVVVRLVAGVVVE